MSTYKQHEEYLFLRFHSTKRADAIHLPAMWVIPHIVDVEILRLRCVSRVKHDDAQIPDWHRYQFVDKTNASYRTNYMNLPCVTRVNRKASGSAQSRFAARLDKMRNKELGPLFEATHTIQHFLALLGDWWPYAFKTEEESLEEAKSPNFAGYPYGFAWYPVGEESALQLQFTRHLIYLAKQQGFVAAITSVAGAEPKVTLAYAPEYA